MIERAAILSTGDEITTGKVVDTNSNYIADKLIEAGLAVTSIVTVGDVSERIVWAWEQAMVPADVIISTGGIGPTRMTSRQNWSPRSPESSWSSLKKSLRISGGFLPR